MTDRTFVCRCEDVTADEVDHLIAQGLGTVEEIKRYTGFGTGPCQGKECLGTLCRILATRGPEPRQSLQPFTARPPAEPVSFAALAEIDLETLEDGMRRNRPASVAARGPDGDGEAPA